MRKVYSKVAAAAAVLMGVASSADAFVILELRDVTGGIVAKSCDTGLAITATNCGAGFTVNDPNDVTFRGIVGDFDIRSSNGVSNFPGTPLSATTNTTSLQVNRVAVALGGAVGIQDLVVDFIGYGFTAPVEETKFLDGAAAMTGNFFSAGDAIQSTFSVNSDNGKLFTAGPPTISNTTCVMAAASSNNCDAPQVTWSDPTSGVAGFSTRTQQVFRTTSVTTALDGSTRLKITPIPEPMSLSLVGAALLGLGFASRRRRAATAKG